LSERCFPENAGLGFPRVERIISCIERERQRERDRERERGEEEYLGIAK